LPRIDIDAFRGERVTELHWEYVMRLCTGLSWRPDCRLYVGAKCRRAAWQRRPFLERAYKPSEDAPRALE
jgi:hypothetical protein